MRKGLVIAIGLGLAVAVTPASAEVRKSMAPCEGRKFCVSYAVTLTPPDGWAIDAAASAERGVEILVALLKSL